MGGQRTHGKAANPVGGDGWRENWDSELTVDYSKDCNGGRNSQFHKRGCWKVGLEPSKRAAFFPLWPLPHRQHHSTAKRVVLPWWIPKTLPPYNLTGAPRQRNTAQIKEQSKTPEKELSNESLPNLSDEEFKTRVIKMLTELTELGRKMEEQVKDTQSEIKQNIQWTNSVTGRKPGLKSMIWNKRKK